MWRGRTGLAALLWIALALVVWNVVFDRVLVLAGRTYVHDASVAATRHEPFLKIDDYMRPAVHRGVWLGSLAGGAIALAGLTAVTLAATRDARRAAARRLETDPAVTGAASARPQKN